MLLERTYCSIDNVSKKYVFPIDNNYVSASYVNHKNHIICFPSSIGCNIGCQICYTGCNNPFKRSLTKYEMVDIVNTIMDLNEIEPGEKHVLFSCMGTGEPLNNIKNVIESFIMLKNLYARRKLKFAISTTVPSANRLIYFARIMKENNIDVKIQISLHGVNDLMRREILSKNIIPLKRIISATDIIKNELNIEWNYCLLEGINDDIKYIDELVTILPKHQKIKLNHFNSWDGVKFKASSKEKVKEFSSRLSQFYEVEIYETNGSDIQGACGQH